MQIIPASIKPEIMHATEMVSFTLREELILRLKSMAIVWI